MGGREGGNATAGHSTGLNTIWFLCFFNLKLFLGCIQFGFPGGLRGNVPNPNQDHPRLI